jgi:hypothetical protein
MISASSQAKTQAALSRQSATYAQQMAERNQKLAGYAADQSRMKGQYEAGLIRERAIKLMARQRALYGGAGVDTEGSPLEFMSQTAAEFERDALNAIFSGEYEGWKYETGGETSLLEGKAVANRYGTEASAYDSKAKSSLFMAPLAMGSSILTGWGRYQMNKGQDWSGYGGYGSD